MSSESVNVRITGELRSFIDRQIGDFGLYESASEYVRDLVRRDKERMEQIEHERISVMLANSMKGKVSKLANDYFDKKRLSIKEMVGKKSS